MLKVGKRAHCIGNIEVVHLVCFGLDYHFAEALHGYLVVVVKCIKVPHISCDDIGRESRLTQDNLQGLLNVVVVTCAFKLEFSEPVENVR